MLPLLLFLVLLLLEAVVQRAPVHRLGLRLRGRLRRQVIAGLQLRRRELARRGKPRLDTVSLGGGGALEDVAGGPLLARRRLRDMELRSLHELR